MRDHGPVTDPFAVPAVDGPVPEPTPFGEPLPAGRRNGVGTAALIVGICSIPLCFLMVLGPIAVVLGAVGRGRASRGQASNGGAALAGILTGAGGIALSVLLVVSAVRLYQSPAFERWQACEKTAETAEQDNACAQRLADELFGR